MCTFQKTMLLWKYNIIGLFWKPVVSIIKLNRQREVLQLFAQILFLEPVAAKYTI